MVSRTCKILSSILIPLFLFGSCASSPQTPQTEEIKGTPREKAAILVEAANGSMIEKDPIGALQHLKVAESYDPKYAPIYHAKALAFHMRKDYARALAEMKIAVDLDPTNSYANNTYGKLLMDANRIAEAEKYLKKAASDSTFRESYKSNTSLGILSYRKDKMDEASNYLDKAITDNPGNACIAYYYKGHIALKRSDLSSAVRFYERASTKLCSAFPDAHLALGMALERDRKNDLARKKYLEVQQNFPETKAAVTAQDRLKKLP